MQSKLPEPKPNKSRTIIGVMLAVVLLGGVVSFLTSGGKGPKRHAKKEDIVTITLPPPPPPPPPPPKVEPPPPKEEPPEQEMVEQEPVEEDEQPPDNAPPDSPPSDDLGPGTPGGSGPAIGGGGGPGGRGIGSGKRGGSRFGWYAAKVQSSIAEALRRHASTRNAAMSLQVRIWPDSTGRITRAQLVGTSGNPAVDQAIKSQILTGLQLPQAPPADMPTPIVLRINARKAVQ
jgi:protein TonB